MAATYVVGRVEEFQQISHKVVKVGKREIGIFRLDETFYALPNLCPHQVGPLCAGKVSGTLVTNKETDFKPAWVLDGQIITCPWHGLEFKIKTGECLAWPIKLRTYPVAVEDGQIKVKA